MKVIDAYDEDSFEELLSEAECNAETPFEATFTSDLRESFDLYRGQMFISDRQIEVLERIANGD